MNTTIPLTARAPRSFTPPTLARQHDQATEKWAKSKAKNRGPKPVLPVFFLAVPTLSERETIGNLMFELGVYPVTRETVRNATLEALMLADEEKGEDDAAWLESHWQASELYEEKLELWREKETQRQIDVWQNNKLKDEPLPMPDQMTSVRDRIKARNMVDEVVRNDSNVRRLLSAQTTYGTSYELMSMRVHLRGWEGLETQREAISERFRPDIVTEECIEKLREEIGDAAWKELYVTIDSMYSLSREEVGNSDSPSESEQSQDGSKPEKAATDAGDSSGTASETSSSSEPTPDLESDKTTAAPSRRGSKAGKGKGGSTRTAKGK